MNAKIATIALLTASATLAMAPGYAENSCKGLSQQACDGSPQCSWVNGYERKDGHQVAPYCRIKSTPQSSTARPAQTSPSAG